MLVTLFDVVDVLQAMLEMSYVASEELLCVAFLKFFVLYNYVPSLEQW